ncbi:MAG TPA: PDZ domain-containing protein, partial [Armatimonadota bacterium]|nr:PDZ domain-containing protein [Armatimonadota bacterium]
HRELLSLIIDRAGLCQHPVAMQHYVREDAVPLRVRSFFISGILAGRSPEGRLIVKEVAAYSSASDVGITPGDEILALHGRSVDGLSAEQVYRALSRREGEMIELRVRHTVQEDVHDYRIRTQQPSGQPALNAGGDLGISVSKDEEGRLLVEALGPGCPAMDAGIRPGDELVSVNGLPADAISAEQAEAEMSGPSGAMVFLTVRREDDVRIEEYRLPTRSMTRE